ncbi:MAG: SpoIIE family protein phosphatase [Acidimicrobiales bacterium]
MLFAAGLSTAIAGVDALLPNDSWLFAAVVFGPLLLAGFGTPAATALVATYAVALAILLGFADDIIGTRGHVARVIIVAVAGAVATWLAGRRQAHEAALLAARPQLDRATQLSHSLRAGRMGTWTWDRVAGTVEWDSELEQLFGLPPGGFDGTFEAWQERIDERDRDRITAAVDAAVASKGQFRFDHRCVWPDGSIHWVEGLGEVIVNGEGEVTGAFGLTISIDDRRRAEEARRRLLELERTARERADYLARANQALGRSLDVNEIVEQVTAAAVPQLADWCSLTLTLDEPRRPPSTVVAHLDPEMVQWAQKLQALYPYDADAPTGAPEVIRSGISEFLPSITDELIESVTDDEELRNVLKSLELRSSITVALPSPLGVLGALQLVRTGTSPPYQQIDVQLAEDLADRIGSALNNALLFRRQRQSRVALDTLQRLTGQLAEALTTSDITKVVVHQGRAGLDADLGLLYLLGDDGLLRLVSSSGDRARHIQGFQTLSREERVPVADAIRSRSIVVVSNAEEVAERYPDLAARGAQAEAFVAAPLEIRRHLVGGLLFAFDHPHRFSTEELAMITTLAGRAAGAVERARLYERQREISLTLQRRLLPALPRLPPWLSATARYLPAPGGEVGGDWFQMLNLGDRVAAAVGDAVGRGITAAAAMGQLRAALASAAGANPDPALVIAATDTFAGAGADTKAASLLYLLLEANTFDVRYSAAGHLPALLVHPGIGTELLDGGRGPLLGIDDSRLVAPVATAQLAPGDFLVLYTDGLVERRGESIDTGIQRLRAAAAALATIEPEDVCDELLARLLGEAEAEDDVALLIIRRNTEAAGAT